MELAGRINTRPGNPMKNADSRNDSETRNKRYVSTYDTTGWRPTCFCTQWTDPVPATVLDPFCGSGTVGAVCRETGRRFVGLDLSMRYLTDFALPRAERKQTAASVAEMPLFAL